MKVRLRLTSSAQRASTSSRTADATITGSRNQVGSDAPSGSRSGRWCVHATRAATIAITTATTAAIADVTGHTPRVEGMTYGADMRLLVNDGNIPTVLFGPGNVRHAHRPNEFVPVEDLLTTARVIALTALRFCC